MNSSPSLAVDGAEVCPGEATDDPRLMERVEEWIGGVEKKTLQFSLTLVDI